MRSVDTSLSLPTPGLTTHQAHYSRTEHETWHRLYSRLLPRWERYASPQFLDGLSTLCLDPFEIPRLEGVNRRLARLTGFRAVAVPGYVPATVFFDCLRRRTFPTTVTIRPDSQLDYLPEPDIFHDVAGHVPMHTDSVFAGALVRIGECACQAAGRSAAAVEAMARFFWFTVEFGLMRAPGGIKAYGSGLLSSYGELAHALESSDVERRPASLAGIVCQSFEIDHYQSRLFVVESFEHLYDMAGELERWMRSGRLDHSASG